MKFELLIVILGIAAIVSLAFMARGERPAKPEKPPKPPKPPKRQGEPSLAMVMAALFGMLLPGALLTGCGVREAVGDTLEQKVGGDGQVTSNSFMPHMATFDVPVPILNADGTIATEPVVDKEGKVVGQKVKVSNKSITLTRGGPSNRRVVTATDGSTIDVTSNASATNYATVRFDPTTGKPVEVVSDGMFDLGGSYSVDPKLGVISATWNYSSAEPVRAVNEQYKDLKDAWNVATPAQKEQIIEANRERTKQAQIAGDVVSEAWTDFLSAVYPPAAVAASLQPPKSPIDPAALK